MGVNSKAKYIPHPDHRMNPESEIGAKPLGRYGGYTGKWTETVAISHKGPSDPDSFRLTRDSRAMR